MFLVTGIWSLAADHMVLITGHWSAQGLTLLRLIVVGHIAMTGGQLPVTRNQRPPDNHCFETNK